MNNENYVNGLLLSKGIHSIEQLNIQDLSEAFDLDVYYWYCSSCTIREDGQDYIIIDKELDPVIQYEQFLHELGHLIFTPNIKTMKDFRHWRHMENKINRFIPYIAMPKFALDGVKLDTSIGDLSELFGVTNDMVNKRLILLSKE